MTSCIRARFVIGFDGHDHVIYEDADVVWSGDTLVFVGHDYPEPVDVRYDVGDAIVSPGFIDLDALADIDHAILDTWHPPDRAVGLQWSADYVFNRRHDVFSREEETLKRRYALVQLLLNGVTTAMPIAAETHKAWAETYAELVDMTAIAAELGLRMYLGPSFRSGVNAVTADGTLGVVWDEPLGEDGLAQAVDFVGYLDHLGDSRLRGALLPCRIESCTPDLLRATQQHAASLGVPLRIHAAQGAFEVQTIQQSHGRRSIELLADLGVLGPRTSIPHVVLIEDRELELIAESGTTVIHCPLISIRHGQALRSFDRYRRAGVNIAIGTDTFPPDMLRVLDYGSNLAKLMEHSQSTGRAADLFRAATLGGAAALGRDDLGRLAVGAKADLVVFDLSGLRSGPFDDPIRTLLYNGAGVDVRHVVVDGQLVVRDGQIPGLDTEALRQAGQAYFDKMKAAYSERDYLQRPTAELFPASFPTVPRAMP